MDEKIAPSPKATFVVRIHFRRNSTWQGTITWTDSKRTQNFRSALELIRLMDSALRDQTPQSGWEGHTEQPAE